MKIRMLHFYPDLMNLYGSWGNLAILKKHLEDLDNTVTVEEVDPRDRFVDLKDADFLFMGAGTERSQRSALAAFTRLEDELRDAARAGVTMLMVGTAMELLGKNVTYADKKTYRSVGIANFVTTHGKRRFLTDVYGHTALYPEPVVGFMNSCSVIQLVEKPLLISLDMGYGNEREGAPEGYHENNVFASQLTGPLLVKNPGMLNAVVAAIYAHREAELPALRPAYPDEERAYAVTEKALRERMGKT